MRTQRMFVAASLIALLSPAARATPDSPYVTGMLKRSIGVTQSEPEPAQQQSGESWEGTAPGTPMSSAYGVYDDHEFEVLAGFDNAVMHVSINWDQDGTPAFGLALRLERLVDGVWSAVDASSRWQLVRGVAAEDMFVGWPAPGRYRARVSNDQSTVAHAYRGAVSFADLPGVPQERATADRPGGPPDPKVHVVYFVPSDLPDERLDTSGIIEASVLSMNGWFAQQTGGRRLRLDTYDDGRLDVTFVRGERTFAEYESFPPLSRELLAKHGLPAPGEHLLVYHAGDHPTTCGRASRPLAVIYVAGTGPCRARSFGNPARGPSYLEALAAHELLHTLGAVPLGARHFCPQVPSISTLGHVCTAGIGSTFGQTDPEAVDLMFPYPGFPLSDRTLDIGRDDYYGHNGPFTDTQRSPFWE